MIEETKDSPEVAAARLRARLVRLDFAMNQHIHFGPYEPLAGFQKQVDGTIAELEALKSK